jgi:hypothetical protein
MAAGTWQALHEELKAMEMPAISQRATELGVDPELQTAAENNAYDGKGAVIALIMNLDLALDEMEPEPAPAPKEPEPAGASVSEINTPAKEGEAPSVGPDHGPLLPPAASSGGSPALAGWTRTIHTVAKNKKKPAGATKQTYLFGRGPGKEIKKKGKKAGKLSTKRAKAVAADITGDKPKVYALSITSRPDHE